MAFAIFICRHAPAKVGFRQRFALTKSARAACCGGRRVEVTELVLARAPAATDPVHLAASNAGGWARWWALSVRSWSLRVWARSCALIRDGGVRLRFESSVAPPGDRVRLRPGAVHNPSR